MFLSLKGLARSWELVQVPPIPYFSYPFPSPPLLSRPPPSSAFLNRSIVPHLKCLSLVPFVVSSSLQTGIWLLRHRRPLFCMLAFSHPLRVKQRESSLIPTENVLAPLSRLLYTGWSLEAVPERGISRWGYHLTILVTAHKASFAALR